MYFTISVNILKEVFGLTKDLTVGKPFKTIFLFSLPVIGGNLFQLFYTIADTVIVGRTMGSDALAAVGSTGTFIYFILCFIQGVTSGFGVCLGQLFGEKDKHGMKKSIAASTILTAVFALILTAVITPLCDDVLHIMNTPSNIFDMANEYLTVIILGTAATAFYNLISNLLRALGDSKTPLYFLIFSSVLNIVLDYAFIVPCKMGVSGAAIATILSQLISAVLCTAYALKKYKVFHLSSNYIKQSPSVMKQHLRLALPMGFQMSIMCIGQIAVQFAVNGFGAAAIAGYTAASKIEQIAVLINNAIGISASNFVAQNYGASKPQRIKKGVNASLIQVIIYDILIIIFVMIFNPYVVPLFVENPSAETISYASTYLLTVSPFYPLMATLIVYRNSIQSTGNTVIPFSVCVLELVMRIIAALLFSKAFGFSGASFASPTAWIAANTVLIPSYYIIIKKIIKQMNKTDSAEN